MSNMSSTPDIVLSQTLEDEECRQLISILLASEENCDPKWKEWKEREVRPQSRQHKTNDSNWRYDFDSNRGVYHFYYNDAQHASYRISELANMANGKSLYRRPLSWRLRMGIKHIIAFGT